MYEKLDKIRGDLDRAKQKRADADAKVKALEEKLREAENSHIIANVTALKLTPEQVAQFLQLAASGQLPMNGSANLSLQTDQQNSSYRQNSATVTADKETENDEEGMEDYEDEK